MKRGLLHILFFLLVFDAAGQMEGTLHYMNTLPQVVNNNPAFVPRYKYAVGLPISSLYEGYTNSGFSYNDLVTRQDGQVKANFTGLLNTLPKNTFITAAAGADLFRLGLKINPKIYLSANVTGKGYGRGLLPKDMVSLVVNGNAAYVNSTANVSPKLDGLSYLETAVGAAYQVNPKLTVGGKLKILKGVTNITTEVSDVSIAVDENYGITASAGINVKTSGINSLTNGDYQISNEIKNYMKNGGLAVDLGATYRLLNKLTLNASIIDLGSIRWKTNLYQYTLDKATATYTFSGIDADQLVNGNANEYMDAQMDSIKNKFDLQEGPGSAYRTMLPAKFYLGGNYEIMKNLNVGTVFFAESFRGRFSPGWTTSVNKNFGKFVSGTLSYTMSNRSFNNFGAGLALNFAPVQLYIVGDNLLKIPSSLIVNKNLNEYINNAQVINIRFGLNFVWGLDKSEKGELAPSKTKSVNQAPGKKSKVKAGTSNKDAKYLKVRRKSKH